MSLKREAAHHEACPEGERSEGVLIRCKVAASTDVLQCFYPDTVCGFCWKS